MMNAVIQLFQDVNDCWRWRIVASNGEILASSEAYASKQKCKQTAVRLAEATELRVVK
jgi:uncharacterized protein YegP (UPF0339 family)